VLDVLALLAGAPLPRDGDRSHAEFFELGLDGCLAVATIGGDSAHQPKRAVIRRIAGASSAASAGLP
jgi:hypothetical protein